MLLLILLAIVVLIIGWKMARARLARASEKKWWPQELQHARLAFAERTFKTWRPIRLIARVDRGYKLNGKVHLVEFKTRVRGAAYSLDVIELSAQRLAIETSTHEPVSNNGYVLVQDSFDKRRSVHKVRLLPAADVIALAKRREAILKGRVAPKYTASQQLCSQCAYRAECKPDVRDRG
jgi:hypothetical protein